MIRISTTMMESYRLYKTADFVSIEELIRGIKGEGFTETPQMLLGRAYHSIAEGCGHKTHGVYEVGNFVFDAASVDESLSWVSGGVHEVKGEAVIRTPCGDVRLMAKADHLSGVDINEIKTSEKALAIDRYVDSYQWRSYLYVLKGRRAIYRLVQLGERDNKWFVMRHDSVPLYPYPSLPKDIESLVSEFAQFVSSLGLIDCLREAA